MNRRKEGQSERAREAMRGSRAERRLETPYVWGSNEHSSLCVPVSEPVHIPTRLLALRSNFIRAIAVHSHFSVASSASDELIVWGAPNGQPMRIAGPESISGLGCTRTGLLALTYGGEVYSWDKAVGEYAGGRGGGLSARQLHFRVDIVRIACGEAHSVALDETGTAYSWGRGTEGSLRCSPLP
eukprot:scaffold113829_cov30-Tisochrysis_lutea.AAC.6